MTPLGEAEVMLLLRTCTSVNSRLELLPPNLRWGEFEHRTMRLSALVDDKVQAVNSQALVWRRLMETLNALTCCSGLGVDENPRFWCQCLTEMAKPESELYPFRRDLLTRYRIHVFAMEDTERVASALAICLSKDPTSPAQRERDGVHAKSNPHFVRPPPPLQFELELSRGGDLERYGGSWTRAKQTLWDLNRMWHVESPSAFIEKVAVVLGPDEELLDTTNVRGLREICDVLSLTCVELRQLRVCVRDTVDLTLLYEIRMLMRELVCVDTLERLSWSFLVQDARCAAAICSALPALPSLRSFSLNFGSFAFESASRRGKIERDTYDAWITYALLQRVWQGLSLATEMPVFEDSRERTEKALASTNSLVAAIPEEVVDPVFMPHGASATLRTRATVTAKPFLDGGAGRDLASFIVFKPTRVSVIAQSGATAIIVWPGIGLVWVPMRDLTHWKTSIPRRLRTIPMTKAPLVEVLSCVDSEASAVSDFVKLIGAGLSTLTMSSCDFVDDNDFSQILKSCARLKTLCTLEDTVLSSGQPLLDAYESDSCHISALAVSLDTVWENNEATTPVLVERLITSSRPAARILRKFCLDGPELLKLDFGRVALGVRDNHRLDVLRVAVERDDWDETPAWVDETLNQLVDQPLLQTDHSKRAIYSFLLAARRVPVARSIPLPCTMSIAHFAATPTLRHVTW
jgi:hypothetical protein